MVAAATDDGAKPPTEGSGAGGTNGPRPALQASGGSGTVVAAAPRQRPGSPDDTFHDATEGSPLAGGTAAAAKARESRPRPTSYLFEDPDAPPSVVIPELQKLTVDVPSKDQISIIVGPFVIIFCDLVVPCIIYYSWLSANPLDPGYDKDILGWAILPFGLGELYILVVRVYRLIKYRDECAPLLSRHWWELDATSFIYAAALIAGLIPFIVGSSLAIPQLYLYSPGLYMAFLMFWALLSVVPFKTPVRINSEERGHRMRPLVFYAAEDFFAVDGWQRRDFRIRYRQRYDSSIMFQKMLFELTVWWISGFIVYLGCLSAVIWKNPFHIAFGLSLGLLFAFIITWAICTYIYVQLALEREREWWIKKKVAEEKV